MKVEKNLIKQIAQYADVQNTIAGGIVETYVEVEDLEDGYEVIISNPSVGAEAYDVEIDQYHLFVQISLDKQFINHAPAYEDELAQEPVKIPVFLQRFNLFHSVDVEGIEAVYEEDALIIFIPIRKDIDTNPKKINIREVD